MGGADLDFLRIVGSRFNFKLELRRESEWGVPIDFKKGIWSGVIGSVVNRTADLGIAHVVLVYPRFVAIDYCLTYSLDVHYLSAKPEKISTLWNLAKPFHRDLWLTMVVSMAVIIAAFMFLNRSTVDPIERGFVVFGVICNQSVTKRCMKQGRLLTGFWLFAAYFLMAAYECNLRAYLMSVDVETAIDTELDILDQGRRLYLPKGSFFVRQFKESPYEAQSQLFKTILKEGLFESYVNGFPRFEFEKEMISKKYIFVSGRNMQMSFYDTIIRRHGRQPFHMSKLPIKFGLLNAGIAIAKNSMYKPHFDSLISRLKAGGITEHIIRTYTWNWYEEELQTGSSPITLTHISLGLFAWIVGVTMSGLVLALETLMKNHQGKTTNLVMVKPR